MILHGSVIQADTIIGKHVLVNTAASIDHENVIGDYAHALMLHCAEEFMWEKEHILVQVLWFYLI
jgi:carbonic anhydrase/acetyltransferase-like protein (isoleucine patch superfamily)